MDDVALQSRAVSSFAPRRNVCSSFAQGCLSLREGTSFRFAPSLAAAVLLLALASGCTSFRQYVHNGFKVGPNYCDPGAPVPDHYIDANDRRVREETVDHSEWWTVFNDSV